MKVQVKDNYISNSFGFMANLLDSPLPCVAHYSCTTEHPVPVFCQFQNKFFSKMTFIDEH